MGIRGMETFLERNHGTACFNVDISAEIQKAKREHMSTTIVVDAMSCLRYLYGDLPWIPGGQVKEFIENIERFVSPFIALGAELVFFYDGPPAEVKLDVWKKRRLDTMEKCINMLDEITAGQPASSYEGTDWQMIPGNIGPLSGVLFQRHGCKVIQSIGECDEEIARYAYQNRCLAIFGQDTDFVIYPGAPHYWSVKHFNKHNMTTLEYSGRNLAYMLHLHFEQLPLLATLLGNDVIQRDELRAFHNRLGSSYYAPRNFSFQRTVHQVASFIKGYPYGDQLTPYVLRQLSYQVFSDESKWTLLQDSIQSYNITRQPKDDLEITQNEKWNRVLRLVRDMHISGAPSRLYGAVVRRIYNCATCLEDYRLSDLPLNQVILKKLRQKIFGILLFDYPKDEDEVVVVRELAVSDPQSVEDYQNNPVIFPNVYHPGLVDLWMSDENSLEDVRWNLLCDTIGYDYREVKDSRIPRRLTVFLLAMKYLMEEGMKLQRFELHALISSAVILVNYAADKLKRLPLDPLYNRGIRLYTLVTQAYGSITLLNSSCGNPISSQDVHADNYQDGKLFQHTYRQARNGSRIEELCEYNNGHIKVFNVILSMLPVEKAVLPAPQ